MPMKPVYINYIGIQCLFNLYYLQYVYKIKQLFHLVMFLIVVACCTVKICYMTSDVQ